MEEFVVERGQDERESAVGVLRDWICNITWGVFFFIFFILGYRERLFWLFWGFDGGLDIDGDC